MPDQKPPRLDSSEGETLTTLLQYQRDSLVRKVAGVDDEAARRAIVGSGTTLLWLMKHLARAESLWVVERFAGRTAVVADDTVEEGDTLVAAVDRYQSVWPVVDEIITAAGLDDDCRDLDGAPVNLRWVLMHLLEETARHAGHADILREMIDGSTGR